MASEAGKAPPMPQRIMQRATAPYEEAAGRFGPPAKQSNQYANLYFTRLGRLGPLAQQAARRQWGDVQWVKTLDADPGGEVYMVGTLYKEMAAKPNVLDDESKDTLQHLKEGGDQDEGVAKYCGDGDSLMLEDESGRIALAGAALEGSVLVTGAVVAVRGQLSLTGTLEVSDICLPGLPPQAAMSAPEEAGERYVALVSGLRVGRDGQDMLPLTLLSEYLTGQLGGPGAHKMQAATVRLVVAGNAMCDPTAAAGRGGGGGGTDVMKKVTPSEQRTLAECVGTLDTFLTTIAAAMPVDLMPGDSDPCNYLLPQQPLHRCMLPQASRLATLNLCTNPHSFALGGVSVLGTSGQPIDDIQRYLPRDGAAERLDALAQSLRFQHLAPTAPDTLGCSPFTDHDPFVIDKCPHLYFAANQPCFGTRLESGPDGQAVRLVLVPDFAREATCVLVNLRTLDCQSITFGEDGIGDAN